jgi:hypothetical protein
MFPVAPPTMAAYTIYAAKDGLLRKRGDDHCRRRTGLSLVWRDRCGWHAWNLRCHAMGLSSLQARPERFPRAVSLSFGPATNQLTGGTGRPFFIRGGGSQAAMPAPALQSSALSALAGCLRCPRCALSTLFVASDPQPSTCFCHIVYGYHVMRDPALCYVACSLIADDHVDSQLEPPASAGRSHGGVDTWLLAIGYTGAFLTATWQSARTHSVSS